MPTQRSLTIVRQPHRILEFARTQSFCNPFEHSRCPQVHFGIVHGSTHSFDRVNGRQHEAVS